MRKARGWRETEREKGEGDLKRRPSAAKLKGWSEEREGKKKPYGLFREDEWGRESRMEEEEEQGTFLCENRELREWLE